MAEQIKYGRYLHGGDYNPEQWLDRPDILQKDIEYFKKAHINTVSVGIFSWAVLEPEEGKYNFDWLEEIINNLYKEGIYTILATPSGARPKWMADKYEEVLRMDPDRTNAGVPHSGVISTTDLIRLKVRPQKVKMNFML